MKKGLSPFISLILVVMISIAGMVLVLRIGRPLLEKMEDFSRFSEAKDVMNQINSAIKEVSYEGNGSSRKLGAKISGGEYRVSSSEDSIIYELESKYELFPPGMWKRDGDLVISTGGDVKAYEADVTGDGQTELVLENSRILFAINKTANETSPESLNTKYLIKKLWVKDSDTNITPTDSSIQILNTSNSSFGTGYTELLDTGSHLNKGRIKLSLTTSSGVNYYLVYSLTAKSDFVKASVGVSGESTSLVQNPIEEYCYQETANQATSCGGLSTGGYDTSDKQNFYINYTKPTGATSSSLWKIKHGELSTKNISIPLDCWSYYDNKIRFRMWSAYDEGRSKAYCYNGSWKLLSDVNGADCTGWGTRIGPSNLYDGNWGTEVKGHAVTGSGDWCTGWNNDDPPLGCPNASIYEEAMWWVSYKDFETYVNTTIKSGSLKLEERWFDSSFKKCQNITVSSAISDYQYKVIFNTTNFNYSYANDTGSDIRIVNASCGNKGNEMPHWVELWNESGDSIVWFRGDNSSTTVYSVYYNYTDAESKSNGTQTFLLFDDFEGTDYDHDTWETAGSQTTWTVANSVMTMQSTGDPGVSGAEFRLKQSANITADGVFLCAKMSVKRDTNSWATHPYLYIDATTASGDPDYFIMYYRVADNDHMKWTYSFNGTTGDPDNSISSEGWTDDAWHYFIMKKDSTAPYTGVQVLKADRTQWGNAPYVEYDFTDDLSPFYFLWYQRVYSSGYNTKIDYVFVGKYNNTLNPTTTIDSEENQEDMKYFSSGHAISYNTSSNNITKATLWANDTNNMTKSFSDSFNDYSKLSDYENVTVENGNLKLNFGKCQNLTISSSISDYQHKVIFNTTNFNYSYSKDDGSDLRIYNSSCNNGGQEMNYWIEKWNESGDSTVWFRGDNLSTTIYSVYYNSSEGAKSNGTETFPYFHDFTSDPNTIYQSSCSYSSSGSGCPGGTNCGNRGVGTQIYFNYSDANDRIDWRTRRYACENWAVDFWFLGPFNITNDEIYMKLIDFGIVDTTSQSYGSRASFHVSDGNDTTGIADPSGYNFGLEMYQDSDSPCSATSTEACSRLYYDNSTNSAYSAQTKSGDFTDGSEHDYEIYVRGDWLNITEDGVTIDSLDISSYKSTREWQYFMYKSYNSGGCTAAQTTGYMGKILIRKTNETEPTVTIGGQTQTHPSSGYAKSSQVSPSNLIQWKIFQVSDNVTPDGVNTSYKILNSSDDSTLCTISSTQANSGYDISSCAFGSIKLYTNLSTTNDSNTPSVHEWNVTWMEQIGNITYELSADGGDNWEQVQKGQEHTFSNPGNSLKTRINLTTFNTTLTPSVENYTINYTFSLASLMHSLNYSLSANSNANDSERWICTEDLTNDLFVAWVFSGSDPLYTNYTKTGNIYNISITSPYDVLLAFSKERCSNIRGRESSIVSGDFWSMAFPAFSYESINYIINIILEYTKIDIVNTERWAEGYYDIFVKNEGYSGGKIGIRVSVI